MNADKAALVRALLAQARTEALAFDSKRLMPKQEFAKLRLVYSEVTDYGREF